MNGKTLRLIALGLGGLVAALALVVGAFALAGQQIAQPAGVPIFTTSTTPSPTPGDDRTASPSPERERTDSPSPSVDDHGGGTGESTSGGSSGSDDGGGSGGHDSSGSGSGDSGSGSGDSSGSGSGPSEHGDD
jgi:hypothetical protein